MTHNDDGLETRGLTENHEAEAIIKQIKRIIDHNDELERVARALSQSVRHFAGKGQYEEGSDEQKAYLDGVETAIGMMYIDLTGTPKSKGILTTYANSRIQERGKEWESAIEDYFLSSYPIPDTKVMLGYIHETFREKYISKEDNK